MKNQRKGSTWDLELVGMISALVLILCFGVIFLDLEVAQIFITIVVGMGVILNSVLAMLKFHKNKTAAGVFFTVISIGLLVVFILRLFFLNLR